MKRSSFMLAGVAAAAVPAAAKAATVPGGSHFVERASDFDRAAFAAAVGRPADIRQLFEAIAFKPAMFNNIKNALNGLQFGYGIAPSRISIAVALHGPSSAYNYSDYVWQKYRLGEYYPLKNDAGEPIANNVFLKPATAIDSSADPDDEKSAYQDTSITGLQRRGVLMLTCHTAVEEQARGIVKKGFAPSGMTPSEVADDILTHLIPGAIVVPSMVATIAILQQQYHYAYTTLVL